MSTTKYTYYIDYGSGYQRIYPKNNKLEFGYMIHEDWIGNSVLFLEGSFELDGADFDLLIANFDTSGNTDVPFRIYENGTDITGTLLFDGVFTKYNEPDYNKKRIVIKDFIPDNLVQRVIDAMSFADNIHAISYNYHGSVVDEIVYNNLNYSSEQISEHAFHFYNIINGIIEQSFMEKEILELDVDNAWFNIERIDIEKLMIFQLNSYIYESQYAGGDHIGGSAEKINLELILKFFEIALRAYWYIDDSVSPALLKFKTPEDFISNTLDLSALYANKDRLVYDVSKNYRSTYFSFHKNNYVVSASDWELNSNSAYYKTGSTKSDKIDELPFQTFYRRGDSDDFSSDGWFIAYVNISDNKMEYEEGEQSGNDQDNGKLCQANVIRNYYNDYLWTEKENTYFIDGWDMETFDFVEVPFTVTRSQPFIEIPSVTTVLDSIATFYDSIIYKKDENYNYIARVKEQRTNLNNNQTTFKGHYFMKQSLS